MAFGIFEILLGIITLLLLCYYYLTKKFNFWTERGIPGPKPLPAFGSVKDIVLRKHSFATYTKSLYDQYEIESAVGLFMKREPVLLIKDLDTIKNVLIKDFQSFDDRGAKVNEKHDPLLQHLFMIEPKRWRPLRAKLTPVFTSGKLKDMFYLLAECGDKLDKHLNQYDGKDVDMREISARFTTDVIGVCAFGLQANALEDENSIFRKMGKRVFQINWKIIVKFELNDLAPFLYNIVGGFLTDHIINNFFIDLTRDTIEYRKKNNIYRHDFIDLLAALREDNNQFDNFELTDTLLAAQLFVFFLAGFETSSSTMSNCLFELALNHDIQTKLRQEITEELKKNDGKITYESIKNMKYLDKVFNETLRKYPPLTILMRKSTASYTFHDMNISIPADTAIWIPIYAIHRDPKYFPNPELFDPERFSPEEVAKRHPMSYLPFGDGPRNCIGLRFALMQTKVGLVKILQHHTVDVCEKTDKDYKLDAKSFLLTPANGIVLKIKKQ